MNTPVGPQDCLPVAVAGHRCRRRLWEEEAAHRAADSAAARRLEHDDHAAARAAGSRAGAHDAFRPSRSPKTRLPRARIDDINRNSPLKPVFYELDAAEVDADGQQVLQANAEVLRSYPSWQISIEGHCDERGTAEYNLALGERRAVAARNYLVSLGIPADRVKTVSYGKEFPFDPGHNEEAWSKNRRAHFVVTAK